MANPFGLQETLSGGRFVPDISRSVNRVMAKKVDYCSHIREGQARQYMRVSGPQYDLIICWKCQQESGQYLAQVQDLVSELKKLVQPEKQTETTSAPTEIFKRGDQVFVTYQHRTVSNRE